MFSEDWISKINGRQAYGTYLSDNYCHEFFAKNVTMEYGISDHTAETVKMGDKTIEIVPTIDWLRQR